MNVMGAIQHRKSILHPKSKSSQGSISANSMAQQQLFGVKKSASAVNGLNMDPIAEHDDEDALPRNFADFKKAKAEISEMNPVKSALK